MQKTNKKRGRPRKKPLSDIEKWGIKILMGCLEQQLIDKGILIGGLNSKKNTPCFNEIINEYIIENLSQANNTSKVNDDITLGGWDFWKNLINIYCDKEEVDHPKLSYLDVLVSFVFKNKCKTWNDYIATISNLLSLADFDTDLNLGFYCPVENITPANLNEGQIVLLGWFPMHFFIFEYLGNSEFKVLYAPPGDLLVPESIFAATAFKVDFNWVESKRIVDGAELLCKTPQYAPPTISPIYIVENL